MAAKPNTDRLRNARRMKLPNALGIAAEMTRNAIVKAPETTASIWNFLRLLLAASVNVVQSLPASSGHMTSPLGFQWATKDLVRQQRRTYFCCILPRPAGSLRTACTEEPLDAVATSRAAAARLAKIESSFEPHFALCEEGRR